MHLQSLEHVLQMSVRYAVLTPESGLKIMLILESPAYGHIKSDVFHEGYNGKRLSFLETLGSAALA